MDKLHLACTRRLLGLAVVSLAIFGLGTPAGHAQRVRIRGGIINAAGLVSPDSAENDDSGPSHFAPPDRKILQLLARSKKALDERRYGEALEGLTEILRGGEDYLYQPDRKLSIYRSLKAEAQQLLGQMPREGRELYEVRSGSEARDRLKKAVAAGDANALSEISGQFFHTQAGYEAAYLRALNYMDHGAPLAAALTLKRLRESCPAADGFEPGLSLTQAACYYQAGMMPQCQQVLVDLKRRTGKSTLPIDGHDVAWFEQENEAPDWLAKLAKLQRITAAVEADQWTMFRGDPSRSASTVGSAPLLNLRWRVELVDGDEVTADALRDQDTSYRQRGLNVLAGLHPLAVGDKLVMRTATRLLGVDFKTGKREWEASIAKSDQEDFSQNQINRFGGFRNNNMTPAALYGQRIWDDATYGTMSSDGKTVFVVEQLSLSAMSQFNNNVVIFGGGRAERSNRGVSDRLAAYDIQSGKVIWDRGGLDDQELADTFFLGPPLPLRGQLYVIAEIKDEIRLLALDPENKGHVLWQQQLAMVESSISQDPIRRLAGVSPSYADGSFDLSHRFRMRRGGRFGNQVTVMGLRLRARRKSRRRTPLARNAPVGHDHCQRTRAGGPLARRDGDDRRRPSAAHACRGRLPLLRELGRRQAVLETAPRGEHYYIACVHEGKVVIVGRNSIDSSVSQTATTRLGSALRSSFPPVPVLPATASTRAIATTCR